MWIGLRALFDLRVLQRRLQKRTDIELQHVVLLYWGIYPGIAIGPLNLFSVRRILAWGDEGRLLIFSGWLRKLAEFEVEKTPIDFSPRDGSFYARLAIKGRRYWVNRNFYGAVIALIDRANSC